MPDNEPSAGATPAAGGATPPQTPPDPPATDPPATGDPDDAGEGAKSALAKERAAAKASELRAKAAETALAELKAASQTEAERAVTQARKDGAAEVLERVQAQIRRSEVKSALTAAGVNPAFLALAVKADEFANLTVDDDGEVEGLTEAVAALKSANKALFTSEPAAGTADGGGRGSKTITKEQAKAWAKDPELYEQHRDEILAAMRMT